MKKIVLTSLLMLSLNLFAAPAPSFKLMGSDGKEHSLEEYKDQTIVLEWFNFGCPFVRKHYDTENMQALQKKYRAKGIKWFMVVSSAEGKQGYLDQKTAPGVLSKEKSNADLLLFDPSGTTGKKYQAKTTPHMYIVHKGELAYQGAIDDTPDFNRESIKTSTNYIAKALDEILAGKKVSIAKTNPYGCSVKYKD